MTSTRRQFIRTSAAGLAVGLLPSLSTQSLAQASVSTVADGLAGRLFKTLKIGMIKVEGNLTDKFKAAQKAGFQGVELDAPGFDPVEVREAIASSGLPVDGTVCASHWKIRHTSPEAATREQALKDLKQALRDTRAVGGHTVLLVAGHGDDGPLEEIWSRAVENISLAVPLAAELGVAIAIENVWNKFGYNHEGGADQSAEQYVKFVDEFQSPWVGMQFDIGNHWKYGAAGDWIRELGKRIIKLDVKGFSRAQNKFTPIGQGDIDYADVRKALREIRYHGWIAAEVAGGDLAYLTGVAKEIDTAFGL